MSDRITRAFGADHADRLPLDALVEAWDLGPWSAPVRLAGSKSEHYRVEPPSGNCVLRRSHAVKARDDVRCKHQLVAFLCVRGYPSSEVVSARPGADGPTSAFLEAYAAGVPDSAYLTHLRIHGARHALHSVWEQFKDLEDDVKLPPKALFCRQEFRTAFSERVSAIAGTAS